MKIKVNKRLQKCAILIFIMFGMLNVVKIKCSADEPDFEDELQSAVDNSLDEFYDTIPDGMTQYEDLDEISTALGIKELLTIAADILRNEGGRIGALLLSMLGVALFSSLASAGQGTLALTASRSVCVVFSAMLFERLAFLTVGVKNTLTDISQFFGAVIPVTVSINSLGVSPTTASTQAIGMGLTLGIYSYVCSFALPIITGAIFVSSAAASIDPVFARIARSLKNVFISVMGIMSTVIGAVFSLQSTISASADSTVIRGAKYAISSTVPIVGGTVSGALGVLSGGVDYARDIVGGGAIAVIITLFISPLILLLLYRTCLLAGGFLIGLCSDYGGEGVINSFVFALDTLIAAYALTSIVYIIELIAFLKGGAHLA